MTQDQRPNRQRVVINESASPAEVAKARAAAALAARQHEAAYAEALARDVKSADGAARAISDPAARQGSGKALVTISLFLLACAAGGVTATLLLYTPGA